MQAISRGRRFARAASAAIRAEVSEGGNATGLTQASPSATGSPAGRNGADRESAGPDLRKEVCSPDVQGGMPP